MYTNVFSGWGQIKGRFQIIDGILASHGTAGLREASSWLVVSPSARVDSWEAVTQTTPA